MGTKAVRFSDNEEKLINSFIEQNPFFDFSSLARIAILKFIERPDLKINRITSKAKKEKKSIVITTQHKRS